MSTQVGPVTGREITIDRLTMLACIGEKSISVKKAKDLLGWEEGPEGQKAPDGKRYVCHNIVKGQRPFEAALATRWMNEILGRPGSPPNPRTGLGGNWEVTGQTIIITNTGVVQQGQHRLIALVWAGMVWRQERDQYPGWEFEPCLPTLVARGIEEHESVLYAMDIGKPWSFADGIYASGMFDDLEDRDRKRIVKIAEHAVRFLWERAGGDQYAYSSYRSPLECKKFLDRHQGLLDCIKFIYSEDQGEGPGVSTYITPGYASGFLYLMACSGSDPTTYHKAIRDGDPPDETMLDDWDRMDGVPEKCIPGATDFWAKLLRNEDFSEPVRTAIADAIDRREGLSIGEERKALIAKAWNIYVEQGDITGSNLNLKFVHKDGVYVLDEFPTVGGIDLGPSAKQDDQEEEEVVTEKPKTKKKPAKKVSSSKKRAKAKPTAKTPDPSPDEIAARAREARDITENGGKHNEGKKSRKKTPVKKKKRPATKSVDGWKTKMTCWVVPQNSDAYQGRISLLDGKKALVEVMPGFQGAGTDSWIPISQLQAKQPLAVVG